MGGIGCSGDFFGSLDSGGVAVRGVRRQWFASRCLGCGLDDLRRLHEAGTQGGTCRLGRFRGRFARPLATGVGKESRGKRNLTLAGLAFHELTRDDFLDGTRCTLHGDAGLALEQGHGVLARETQQLGDLVNSNSGQIGSSSNVGTRAPHVPVPVTTGQPLSHFR
jgi:hypothetical protein